MATFKHETFIFFIALLLAGFGLLVSVAHFNLYFGTGWDEVWIVQVLSRLQSGETLYKDIFYSVPPLSLYLALPFVKIIGVELLTVKCTVVLSFTLSFLLVAKILKQLTATHRYTGFLAAAFLLHALPLEGALYQPLANLFHLLALWALLKWEDSTGAFIPQSSRGIRWLVILGGVSGLGFTTKQNVGGYTLAITLLLVLLSHFLRAGSITKRIRSGMIDCVIICLTFVLIVCIVLTPVVVSGGTGGLWRQGFLIQREYLQYGSVSYWDGLKSLAAVFSPMPRRLPLRVLIFNTYQIYLLPLAALLGVITALVMSAARDRKQAIIILGFTLIEVLTIFPRADWMHVVFAVPGLWLAILISWDRLKPRFSQFMARGIEFAAILIVVGGVSFKLAMAIYHVGNGSYVWSALPHFQNKLMLASEEKLLREHAQSLVRESAGAKILLLIPNASLYYLASGLKNPSRYDFPMAATLGAEGEEEVIRALTERRIQAVCLQKNHGPIALRTIEQYVETRLQRGADLGFCTMYRVPASNESEQFRTR